MLVSHHPAHYHHSAHVQHRARAHASAAPRPPTVALKTPAVLSGASPLRYHLMTNLGDNTSRLANVARREMCMQNPREDYERIVCSCQ